MASCAQYKTLASCNTSPVPGTESSDPSDVAYCQWDSVTNKCNALDAAASTSTYDPTDMDSLVTGIDASQKAELEDYKKLKNPTLSEAEKSSIRDDINTKVQERTEMFAALIAQYTAMSGMDSSVQRAMEEQIELRKTAEEQLSNVKKMLPNSTKTLKMVEINAYYAKQYAAYANYMKWLTFLAAIILLSYWGEAYTDPWVMATLRKAVYIIGGGYMVILTFDLMLRRSDKYDEYRWPFAPTDKSQLEAANAQKKNLIEVTGINIPGVCAGSYCCGEGTTWDKYKGCVVTPQKTYLVK
jgi:hypothetical protein